MTDKTESPTVGTICCINIVMPLDSQFLIRIDAKDLHKLGILAAKNERSASAEARLAIAEHLEAGVAEEQDREHEPA